MSVSRVLKHDGSEIYYYKHQNFTIYKKCNEISPFTALSQGKGKFFSVLSENREKLPT